MPNKTIHYIWLGGKKKPHVIRQCIKSWRKFFPGWDIKEWNESNVNLDINRYCRQAYDARKYAFASDVLRFDILYRYGGIYFDTDVKVLKSFAPLMEQCDAFSGFENECVAPGLVLYSKEPNNPLFAQMLKSYEEREFLTKANGYDLKTVVQQFTEILIEHGLVCNNTLQTVDGFTVFPKEYFCPADYSGILSNQTDNTYSVHLFAASWLPRRDKCKLVARKWILKLLGPFRRKKQN